MSNDGDLNSVDSTQNHKDGSELFFLVSLELSTSHFFINVDLCNKSDDKANTVMTGDDSIFIDYSSIHNPIKGTIKMNGVK